MFVETGYASFSLPTSYFSRSLVGHPLHEWLLKKSGAGSLCGQAFRVGGRPFRLQLDKISGGMGEDAGTALLDQNYILDADAAPPGQVDPRFDSNYHASA